MLQLQNVNISLNLENNIKHTPRDTGCATNFERKHDQYQDNVRKGEQVRF
jgi:hypothetical protein